MLRERVKNDITKFWESGSVITSKFFVWEGQDGWTQEGDDFLQNTQCILVWSVCRLLFLTPLWRVRKRRWLTLQTTCKTQPYVGTHMKRIKWVSSFRGSVSKKRFAPLPCLNNTCTYIHVIGLNQVTIHALIILICRSLMNHNIFW